VGWWRVRSSATPEGGLATFLGGLPWKKPIRYGARQNGPDESRSQFTSRRKEGGRAEKPGLRLWADVALFGEG